MREGGVGFKSFVERKSTIMMVGQRFRSRRIRQRTLRLKKKELKKGNVGDKKSLDS